MKSTNLGIVLAGLTLAPALAAGDVVDWNYNYQAVAIGTACNSTTAYPDTFFVTAGPEISVVFSNMGINLGDEYAPLAERHTCNVRIPVRVAKGLYIGELKQTFIYGVTKSAGALGGISARATFFDLPAARFSHSFPSWNWIDEPMLTRTISNNYRVNAPSWCIPPFNDLHGTYKLNLAVTGQRQSPYNNIIVQIDGADIKFEAVAGIYNCEI